MTIRELGTAEPAMTRSEYIELRDVPDKPWPNGDNKPKTPDGYSALLQAIEDAPDEGWRERASCHPDNRTTPTAAEWTAIWYPENGGVYGQARAICDRCPVRDECRADGAEELHGMWGGESREEREIARGDLAPMTRHGYPFGAQAHRRRGEAPCEECMNVQRDYERGYRARRKARRDAA